MGALFPIITFRKRAPCTWCFGSVVASEPRFACRITLTSPSRFLCSTLITTRSCAMYLLHSSKILLI
uniref:Similar to interaction site E2 of the ubiquitin domain of a ubiquitin-ribosomal protein L40 n=1 Tax=uncultured eukaryote TaxID=100272 RepID=K7ZW72_9EUKA|nr:similar to interaction site E2 of the ubiquitin domain of a ubiquitin-ribosomal protein L40 [uncultured eukaryote]